MISDLRRALRALVRSAAAVLALVVALSIVASPAARSAGGAPEIVSVDVTGNLHVPTATIMQVIQARPGEAYDPKIVQGDLQRISALGYFADIAAPLIRARPNGVAITYRVIEYPVVTKIDFTGNKSVPTDTLLALMDLSVGQVFNTNTFHSDVLKINNYYERIGYGGQVATHIKNLNFDTKTGALSLTIIEGLTVRAIEISGDPFLPIPLILQQLTLKPGMVYSDQIRQKDQDKLKSWYDDKWHIELGNFEAGIDPTSVDEKTGTAIVKYEVDVARVAAVQITGNTRTKDRVVRRLLRVTPGMIVNTDWIKADYERLNSTGYFSKVNPDIKQGPDPKKPQDVTLVWELTEQRTAQASIGFGYSGGITGEGLYGTLGFTDTNLHGTGNSASIQFQQGARTTSDTLSGTIPYLGDSPKAEKYSLSASIFSIKQTYYYPVYSVTSNTVAPAPIVGGTSPPIPVTLYENSNAALISGVVSTSASSQQGFNFSLGRRLSDYITASLTPQVSTVKYSTTVPSPYYFSGSQPNVLVGPTPNPLESNETVNGSFGISASSIANVNTGLPYQLNTLTFGLGTSPITVDDPYNPRHGWNASFSEQVSSPSFDSSFDFTETSFNVARFLPVLRSATFAIHGLYEFSTGVIPPNNLFTFSDQQVRGYDTVFYGTDAFLGQVELRQPLTADRKLSVVGFVDELDYRIRGAYPELDPYTNRVIGYPADWSLRGDLGVGLRFDVPQLGLHTIRIDFAKGADGTHTSFGIGQSF
ncbi:MAG TPA: POTRA domain-containing protein [Candidatus Acidoferrum sp.]|jgi:outer membrane protein assembly factor BamA|nr:POTRA domain-containing protein [Candidatus Acidoferrum sp.]